MAASLITQKWAQEQLNHFTVTFHSDGLIECGVKNELWKLVEVTDNSGNAWSTSYKLTDKGSKVVTSADLRESGRGHQIMLKGPYRLEVNSIADGQPGAKYVKFRWDIDWDKAPDDLKTCLPRFELSGTQIALFQLVDNQRWDFVSYVNPEDVQAPPDGSAPPVGVPNNPLH